MTPARLTPAPQDWSRAHLTEIQVRFSDTDALGHVNNVSFAAYLETARVDLFAELRAAGGDIPTVLAHLSIDFRREIKLDQQVQVQTLCVRLGRSSWTYAQRILAGGGVCAEASSVQVHVNPLTMRPESVPADVRAYLARHAAPDLLLEGAHA